MGNPFAKCNQKGESFSGLWKLRADENIHFHWTSDGLFGGETFMGNTRQTIRKMSLSRISRITRNGSRWFLSHQPSSYGFLLSNNSHSSTPKVFSCRETYSWTVPSLHVFKHQIHHQSGSLVEEQLDPFSLVADELSVLANRLRSMVIAEVPKLASAAEYFFKMGVEGKRFRPTVLLLMATALNVHILETTTSSVETTSGVGDALTTELRKRQQSIAEITEMIHVASLLHDDVLDDADTRRGIGSLNFVMGNKVAVLAGDFLLSRACVALASLKNTELTIPEREIVTAPILFAMEEFPQLRSVIDWGFDKPENIDVALEYLGKSRGIQRTRELAAKHANLAAAAIDSLPETDDEEER
ncbi:hypothetical protein NC651_024753 [Populus alba x Populus x berolinensis]|nr:hypothetical protein NC651_024753 [Populus alba x Populus x berolinensis]